MRFVMKVSDRVVVLNYGEVISVGTPEEVSGDHRIIEAYLDDDYRAHHLLVGRP
jgi:branched-chain amino acid transport system ATP-binding protein